MNRILILLFVSCLLSFAGCSLVQRDYEAYKYAKTDPYYAPRLAAAEDNGAKIGAVVGSVGGGLAPVPGGSIVGQTIGTQAGKGIGLLLFILFNANAILKKKESETAPVVAPTTVS